VQVDITTLKVHTAVHRKAKEMAHAGWLDLDRDVLSFPSSLQMQYYRYFFARRAYSTVLQMPDTLRAFLPQVISRMHPLSLSQSLNVSRKGAVHEPHYQFELYR
jgi:hypothetical protein